MTTPTDARTALAEAFLNGVPSETWEGAYPFLHIDMALIDAILAALPTGWALVLGEGGVCVNPRAEDGICGHTEAWSGHHTEGIVGGIHTFTPSRPIPRADDAADGLDVSRLAMALHKMMLGCWPSVGTCRGASHDKDAARFAAAYQATKEDRR